MPARRQRSGAHRPRRGLRAGVGEPAHRLCVSRRYRGTRMHKLERGAQVAVIAIGVVAFVTGMSLAQDVLAPMVLALVIGVVLSPISDMWMRIGFPPAAGALTSLILTLALLMALIFVAQPIVVRIIDAWPVILQEMSATIAEVQNALRGLESVSEQVEGAISGEGTGVAAAADGSIASSRDTAEVAAPANGDPSAMVPSPVEALSLAPAVLAKVVIFAGVLFFFLLTRVEIYAWIARRIAPAGQEREIALRLRAAERQVSTYFITISIINAGLGAAVTIAVMIMGLPSPFIWGAAAMLLNFVLYLGPTALIAAFTVAGIVHFDGAMSLLPPVVYLTLNMIEAQFVTPTALGKRLSVNPLLIFLALVFLLWLWGPLGGIVAIPLLLWGIVLSSNLREGRRELEEAMRASEEARRKAEAA
ncbi:AI-2E family transporter [Rhodobacteraceae bacterium CCMM004]|nr:AI-2E family transporter [Rhodobacteraceae bacterium CCMM004]